VTIAISVDIETYHACLRDAHGIALPPQRYHHPQRMLTQDGITPDRMILSCAITQTEPPPPCLKSLLKSSASLEASVESQQVWRHWLKSLVPSKSMVLLTHLKSHRRMLKKWLEKADILFGKDMSFDLLCLRAAFPELREVLHGRHLLIDLAVVNYLESETRPERTLKNIGPILGVYDYSDEKTLADGYRFPNPHDRDFQLYNARDSHRTVIAIAELARSIDSSYPNTSKLSPYSLHYFSELQWDSIRMSEAGICMDRPALERLRKEFLFKAEEARAWLSVDFDLRVDGEGCKKSQAAFLDRAIDEVDWGFYAKVTTNGGDCPEPGDEMFCDFTVRNDLGLTPTTAVISWTNPNRVLLRERLPEDHSLRRAFDLIEEVGNAEHLVSNPIWGLLQGQRKQPKKPAKSLLLPRDGVWITYPKIYIIPSTFADHSDDVRGQQQARMSFQDPGAQTFHSKVRSTYCSRYGDEGVLLSMDFSQLELRVLALLSGDPVLIDAYMRGLDLHDETAKKLYGQDIQLRETNGERTKWGYAAKQGNFGNIYWAGAETMQTIARHDAGVDLPIEMFDEVVRNRPKTWAVAYEWQCNLIAETYDRGYMEIPYTGHTRRFSGGTKREDNEILNFPIQATGAVVTIRTQYFLRLQLPSLSDPDPDVVLWMNHYDALKLDCRNKKISNLCEQKISRAVEAVRTKDFWFFLEQSLGRHVPLTYDITRS